MENLEIPNTNPTPTPPTKTKKMIFWGIIGVLIVAAVVGGIFYYLKTSSPKQTVKSADTVPYFSVASVFPADQSTGNAPSGAIKVTFTQPVNPNNLKGYFTVSPMVPGTFTQGDNPDEVVFTPKFSFQNGTSVKVLLNQGFESVSGAKFNSDYDFNFYTDPASHAVYFLNDDFVSTITSATPNQTINFNFEVGSEVDPTGTVTLYKGTVDQLLNSLVYSNQANPGTAYVSQNFVGNPVDTSAFQKISTSPAGMTSDTTFNFSEGPGLYYLEADDPSGQATGFTWVNVTDQGLITRQDDQAVYLATQNETTGDTNESVDVTIYNLQDKPTAIGTANITGTGNIPVVYPQVADLAVGQTSDGIIIVPLSIFETQSDTRVNTNLSGLSKVFLYTDRPTYATGDDVKFAGVVRLDNDAQYAIPPAGSTLHIWVPNPTNPTVGPNLVDNQIHVASDGTFSGHFTVPSGLAPSDTTTSGSATLYAQLTSDPTTAQSLHSYTTFDVVGSGNGALLEVNFDKSEYMSNDVITARITGTDSNGQALANQTVTYDEYLKSYYDNDPSSAATFGTDWGAQTPAGDQTVTLDSKGTATITVDKGTIDTSEAITIEANATVGGVKTYGAKTVLMRQGNIVLSFGSGKSSYHNGDTVLARVYAHDLSGNILGNLPLQYEFYYSVYDNNFQSYQETTIASGNATTDSNGFALIQQPITMGQYTTSIRVSAKDNQGNTVEAQQQYIFLPPNSAPALYYHDPVLTNLDVATDKQIYNIGDTANLTINSPFAQTVWVTYERGRVYHSELLALQAGNNSYQIPITAQLSPSFNLEFNYFRNGQLNSEGLTIPVTDPAKNLSITLATDKTTYMPNDQASLIVTAKTNTGAPVQSDVSVEVIDDSIFNLRNTLPSGSINWSFFAPRDDTTNFSASTLGVGTGGGCGGGGDDILYVPNRLGTTVYWNPDLATGPNGQTQISVPLPATPGNYRVIVRGWTGDTAVGQSDSTITIQ